MRKTSIPNKLNHKPKPMQACEKENENEKRIKKNKRNKRKNDCLLKYFAVTESTLEGCRRTVTL